MKEYCSVKDEYFNKNVIIAYITFILATFLSIYAYKGIPLSMGAVLESTSYLYITIFGSYFFKEQITMRKIIAIVLIVVGIVIYSYCWLYYKTILNVSNVNDYTCGYRLYSYDIIKKANVIFKGKLVTRSSFACMMEVLYKLHLVGCRFAEIPFELRYDNKQGQSKMKVLTTIKESVFTALKLRLHF